MREKHVGVGPLSVVYAMAGTTARHNKIVRNIVAYLGTVVRDGPCEPYVIDLKVRAGRHRIYYPDVVVVCTPHSGDTLMFDDPALDRRGDVSQYATDRSRREARHIPRDRIAASVPRGGARSPARHALIRVRSTASGRTRRS